MKRKCFDSSKDINDFRGNLARYNSVFIFKGRLLNWEGQPAPSDQIHAIVKAALRELKRREK